MPIKSLRNSFLLNYLFFGGLSTLFNIFIYKILLIWLSYQIANIITIIMVKIFVFVTNKKYVFKSLTCRKELLSEILRFFIARVGIGLMDFFGVIFLVEVLGFDVFYSKITLVVGVVLANFLLSWSFVFKTRTSNRSE